MTSRDYKRIAATGVNIANILEEGAYQRGEKTLAVDNFVDEWLINESKRGLYINAIKDWVK